MSDRDRIPVIAVLDVGKTNKKLLLFDEKYKVVQRQEVQISEINDDDGDPCEDILGLTDWVKRVIRLAGESKEFDVKAINVSAYGASFVHLDVQGKILTPLYNYLKPYPDHLKKQFYSRYGGEVAFSLQTSSPVLGSLNSGLQIYRLKYEKPNIFTRVNYSLHLPQYLSGLITGQAFSEITSIGCHTGLWDFQKRHYHNWIFAEGVAPKFPEMMASDRVAQNQKNHPAKVGIGLHDSSAALIPYLANFTGSFLLLSTGTWSITLNPFDAVPLTANELSKDCLCYLDYHGSPVKASRLFAGNEHDHHVKRLAEHFHVASEFYKSVVFDPTCLNREQSLDTTKQPDSKDDLSGLTFEQAYHQFMKRLVVKQAASVRLVTSDNQTGKKIFVDGGFSQNPVFMNLLANAFTDHEVFAATVAQSTSLGAALAIHKHWNRNGLPDNLVQLKRYNPGTN